MRPPVHERYRSRRWPPGSGVLLGIVAGMLGWLLLLWLAGVL